MKPLLELHSISKKYKIGSFQYYYSLRDSIAENINKLLKQVNIKNTGNNKKKNNEFWPLRNITFKVNEGDVLGVIGKNGAGKSTLLKLISQITPPTEGKIILRGRVASLLEIGTGFHPELTGRENIFLNGTILGMTRNEIKQKFDEIVQFAEIEKFIDTPVKHYSSGMYMRLAFAVAAHLESEILLIDEVLAVGDASFQKKSLGKMKEVASKGRTVLFVSHNMNLVSQLCNKVAVLEKGKLIKFSDKVKQTVDWYLEEQEKDLVKNKWTNKKNEFENNYFSPKELSIVDKENKIITGNLDKEDEAYLSVKGELLNPDPGLIIGYALYNQEAVCLYWSFFTDIQESRWPKLSKGMYQFKSRLSLDQLNIGNYKIELLAGLYYREWFCPPERETPAIQFELNGKLSDSPYWTMKRPGVLAEIQSWEVKKND